MKKARAGAARAPRVDDNLLNLVARLAERMERFADIWGSVPEAAEKAAEVRELAKAIGAEVEQLLAERRAAAA